ncbi:MAG: hypothetical protein ACRDEA_01110, partial [Microcystaceae cyanobacterium]
MGLIQEIQEGNDPKKRTQNELGQLVDQVADTEIKASQQESAPANSPEPQPQELSAPAPDPSVVAPESDPSMGSSVVGTENFGESM